MVYQTGPFIFTKRTLLIIIIFSERTCGWFVGYSIHDNSCRHTRCKNRVSTCLYYLKYHISVISIADYPGLGYIYFPEEKNTHFLLWLQAQTIARMHMHTLKGWNPRFFLPFRASLSLPYVVALIFPLVVPRAGPYVISSPTQPWFLMGVECWEGFGEPDTFFGYIICYIWLCLKKGYTMI